MDLSVSFSHLLEVCVEVIGVKNLIAIHYCYEILHFQEVGDVMRIARLHVDILDIVAAYLKFNHLSYCIISY